MVTRVGCRHAGYHVGEEGSLGEIDTLGKRHVLEIETGYKGVSIRGGG